MYLTDILDYKKNEIARFRKKHSCSEFENKILPGRESVFFNALKKKDGISIIAEIKKASPSMGVICHDFDPVSISRNYEEIGVNAISVLTDEKFFGGHIDILRSVRETTDLPLLRKDFILDEIQVLEAKASGADAVLLITAALSLKRLSELLRLCLEIGCAPLVEIHDRNELKVALDAGAEIIGVNNRNLKTFKIDLKTSVQIMPEIPPGCLKISESGIEKNEELMAIRKAGADAFLIGTAFMQSKDRKAFIEGLLNEN